LVWLGHSVSRLRGMRATSVGTERMLTRRHELEIAAEITSNVDPDEALPIRWRRSVDRYALDMLNFMREVRRVLHASGKAVLVIGDSCLRGVYIRNSEIVRRAAELVGLKMANEWRREIPAEHRYLPPPTPKGEAALDQRMREEVVITFAHAA